MKIEAEVPPRFCTTHGVKMVWQRVQTEFNSRTGAVECSVVYVKCPRWFCGRTNAIYIVLAGKVVEDK